MKFWQLIDVFRDETKLIENILSKVEWKNYAIHFENRENLIKTQQRDILDAEIDNKLLEQIASKSNKIIYYSAKAGKVYSYPNENEVYAISISDAIKIFNHDIIEEVFEKTEADVKQPLDMIGLIKYP